MKDRYTIAMNVTVDVKINEGADMRDIMNGLVCSCSDTSGQASVMGVDVQSRYLILELDEDPDAE